MNYSTELFYKRRRLRGLLAQNYFQLQEEDITFEQNIISDNFNQTAEKPKVAQEEKKESPEYVLSFDYNTSSVFNSKNKISMNEYLNAGQEKHNRGTIKKEYYDNAVQLLEGTNELLSVLPIKDKVQLSSGFRTKERQMIVNPSSPNSAHTTGEALDIKDPGGKLKKMIMTNPEYRKKFASIMKKRGLYVENFNMTDNWIHVQKRTPGRIGGEIWGYKDIENAIF